MEIWQGRRRFAKTSASATPTEVFMTEDLIFSVTAVQVFRGINHNKIETLSVGDADADVSAKRRLTLHFTQKTSRGIADFAFSRISRLKLTKNIMKILLYFFLTLTYSVTLSAQTVVFEGMPGLPASGKRVVLLAGDEEYRSEEMLTQMARILAKHHGMTCTVLYSINPTTHEIDPNTSDNIPGLEALEKADLMVVFLRFRNLPDEQMDHIVKYLESGRPVLGIRPSVVAFAIPAGRKWSQYGWQTGKGEWDGGFGRRVLGETWISHHGNHKVEATRGEIVSGQENHPIVTGCRDIFGPSDVYTVRLPLPADAQPLVLGNVLKGLNPDDPPVENEKNNPKMPILWTKSYCVDNGKTGLAVTSTIGAGTDFLSEGVRRLMINSCYWLLQMPEKITPQLSVEFVGEYKPLDFGFNTFRKGITTKDVIEGKTEF